AAPGGSNDARSPALRKRCVARDCRRGRSFTDRHRRKSPGSDPDPRGALPPRGVCGTQRPVARGGEMESLEEITGHYVSVGGTRTFFDEVGAGTPIVCVHTAGSDSREYRYLLPLLARRGLRAIAVDLPGHSRSYPVGWQPARTIHEHAEFVYRFANAVCDERPVIMGCSIGGDITLDLVANHSTDLLAAVAMEGAAW